MVSSARKDSSKKRKAKQNPLLAEKLFDEYLEEITNHLGISQLDLTKDEMKEILFPIFKEIVESYQTKPALSSILNKFALRYDQLSDYISSKLLEIRGSKLNRNQLEYVIYNIKKGVNKYISDLYRICLKESDREELLNRLRIAWNSFGQMLPAICPKCKFNSVAPNYTCLVCNHILSDKEMEIALSIREIMGIQSKEALTKMLKNETIYYLNNSLFTFDELPKGNNVYEIRISKELKDYIRKLISLNSPS